MAALLAPVAAGRARARTAPISRRRVAAAPAVRHNLGVRRALLLAALVVVAALLWLLVPRAAAPADFAPRVDLPAADLQAGGAAAARSSPGGAAADGTDMAAADGAGPDRAVAERVAADGRALVGEVVDDAGRPVAFARVKVTAGAAAPREATTAADGTFHVDGLQGRVTRLAFSARGYASSSYDRPGLPDQPEVSWTERLVRAAKRSGAVVCQGAPVAGANVEFSQAQGAPPDEALRRLRVTTDVDGRFEAQLPPGDVVAWAARPGTGIGQADVPPEGDVTIELPPPGLLEVTVVDGAGRVVAGAAVRVRPRTPETAERHAALLGGSPFAPLPTAGDGATEPLELAAATWNVSATAEGLRSPEPQPVKVASGRTSSLRLVLARSASIVGTVIDALTRDPVAGARVDIDGGGEVSPAITDAAGAFRISVVPARWSSVKVAADRYAPFVQGGIDGQSERAQRLVVELMPLSSGVKAAVQFGGIGAVIGADADGVVVRELQPKSPASRALKVGDVVLEADGVSLKGMTATEATSLIRGEAGSEVRLLVRRGKELPVRIDVERARLAMPSRGR